MKNPIDDRVEMPLIFKHLLISVIGITGVAIIYKGESPPDYTDSIIIFLLAIFSGCSTFGFVSILAIFKKGGGFKEVFETFINNLDIVFKDDTRNSK